MQAQKLVGPIDPFRLDHKHILKLVSHLAPQLGLLMTLDMADDGSDLRVGLCFCY